MVDQLPASAASATRSVTFAVNQVRPLTEGLLPRKPIQSGLPGKNRRVAAPALVCPDACSQHPGLVQDQKHRHGFLSAVCLAFDQHLPLVLRPEHFWVLILQAVATHVNDNAKKLRHQFVMHDKTAALTVNRDQFQLHQCGNDWAGVVAEFAQQIGSHIVEGSGTSTGKVAARVSSYLNKMCE